MQPSKSCWRPPRQPSILFGCLVFGPKWTASKVA